MKRAKNASNKKVRAAIERAEESFRIGAKILGWEIQDNWGVCTAPGVNGIAVQMFRPTEQGPGRR